MRREYSGVLAMVIGFVFVEIVRNYFMLHQFFLGNKYSLVLLFTAIAALILRTLKHQTKLLSEAEDKRD